MRRGFEILKMQNVLIQPNNLVLQYAHTTNIF